MYFEYNREENKWQKKKRTTEKYKSGMRKEKIVSTKTIKKLAGKREEWLQWQGTAFKYKKYSKYL